MSDHVKRRSYASARRDEQAAATRRQILETAHRLFTSQGYQQTSVAEIARRADVSVDTLYAAVGRKPQLLLAVHDLVLGDMELDAEARPLVAEQRRYVMAVRAAPTAAGKLQTYADALGRLQPGVAPLSIALRDAGLTDPECRRVWDSIDQRRRANMRLLAHELRQTGELRDDLADNDVADLLWSMNSPAYFTMLAEQGWTGQRYAHLLAITWTRTLLRSR